MRKMLGAVVYTLLIFILFGCGNEFESERFYSMGTFVSVTLPKKDFDKVIDVRTEMTNLENMVTEATKKANETQNFEFTGMMQNLFLRGLDFTRLTNGKFSMYAYTIAHLYGFHEGPYRVPSDKELEEIIDKTDRMEDVLIDMGAFAKGYIVDKSIGLLMFKNVENALINAGGDLYAMGSKGSRPWRIAIKHPDSDEKVLSVVNLQDKALATSGDYERYFETEDGKRIFHIFDTTTGKNPTYYSSVSVIADKTIKADGLATAFFLLAPEEIEVRCQSMHTPVLLYTREKEIIKMCGWEEFEDN